MFQRPPTRVEEVQQRAGTLGELEAAHPLRADVRRAAADHVAHVQLRHLVAGQIRRFVARARAAARPARRLRRASRRDADEDLRLRRVRSAGS